MQSSKFPINLDLEKSGEMIYFSQLDLSLILQRALRRADLPNYFTKGFRPHIKISFQGALKLGRQGKITATFYFKEKLSLEKVITELNAQLPEGLKAREING